jgi:predicted PurR-regulated permease PerM
MNTRDSEPEGALSVQPLDAATEPVVHSSDPPAAAQTATRAEHSAVSAPPDGGAKAAATLVIRAALGAPMRVAVVGLFALALVGALYVSRPLLLPILIAVLLALLLTPLVALLERLRIPRGLAAVAVVSTLLLLIGTLGSYLYGPAQKWMNVGPVQIAELREKFSVLRVPVEAVQDVTEKVTEATSTGSKLPPREVVIERRSLIGMLTSTQSYVVGTLATVILLFFLLASGDMFLRKLIRVIPKFRDKIVAVEITRSIQTQIGRYFASITVINIGLGVLVALSMRMVDMPTPALIGAMAAVLNFIPYIGSAFMLVVVTLMSILTFDVPSAMVIPPLVYLGLTVLEGQVVQPLVLGKRLDMPPVVVFTWVLLWGWLWGVGGVAVAIPLLVALKICADHIPSWASIAELLSGDNVPEK